MQFWIDLWTWFFFGSLIFFAGLVVVAGIGGFFDIRSLFKDLRNQPDPEGGESPPKA